MFAIRSLARKPLFSASIVAILALGIGVNTAVFTIVDAVLLQPLSFRSAARLVRVEEALPSRGGTRVPAAHYLDWRSRGGVFDSMAAMVRDDVTITGAEWPEQVISRRVSAGLFALLGVEARVGRTLTATQGEFNGPNEVVLSDRLWRRLYHADASVVGKALTASDEVYTIVGVMAPEFEFPDPLTEMWIPLRLTAASTNAVDIVARLKEGVSAPQAERAMSITAAQIQEQDKQKFAGLRIPVTPWRDTAGPQQELTLVLVFSAVVLVLLIACADVGALLLSRAVERQREVAIRASLGAGFWRVMRQLLAESFALAAAGSVLGIAAAHFGLQFLARQIAALPIAVPHIQGLGLNGRVLLFNAALCGVLAVVCGVAPMLASARVDLQSVLRTGPSSGRQRGSTRLFAILVGAQAAFAFLLLTGSGLMIRSLIRLQQADHGLNPEHVLTMRVPVGTLTQPRPKGKFETQPLQMAHYQEILNGLQSVPGITAIALVNNLPLSGVNTATRLKLAEGEALMVPTRTVSAQYFTVMGIPLLAGRAFTDADVSTAPRVAILNEFLARQLFGNQNAVGRMISEPQGSATTQVVGVVKNTPQMSYELPARPEIYFPYQQFIFGTFMSTIVVRTTGEPLALAETMRKAVWAVDRNQPVVKVEPMTDVIAAAIWRPRFSAWVFLVLGALALVLTCAGVYSVVAYTSTLRAREFGIRVALGASPGRVICLMVRDAMLPLVVGLALSAGAAVLLSRWLASLLYETGSTDPVAYAGAALLLLVVGVAASARPACKAATGDPIRALRSE